MRTCPKASRAEADSLRYPRQRTCPEDVWKIGCGCCMWWSRWIVAGLNAWSVTWSWNSRGRVIWSKSFACSPLGRLPDELRDAGIHVIAAAKGKGPDLSVMMALRAASRRAMHQIVHTHNPVANYYSCAAEFTSWRSLPIVNTRHNMGASNPNDRREKLFRVSMARTAKVAMVSPQVRKRFIDNNVVAAAKAAVVMNGIPLQRYVQARCTNEAAGACPAWHRRGRLRDRFGGAPGDGQEPRAASQRRGSIVL